MPWKRSTREARAPTPRYFTWVLSRLQPFKHDSWDSADSLYNPRMPTVTFLLGSKVDTDFAKKIAAILDEYQVSSEIIVASAHKVPEKVVQVIEKLNARTEPTVVVTCVGMSNG